MTAGAWPPNTLLGSDPRAATPRPAVPVLMNSRRLSFRLVFCLSIHRPPFETTSDRVVTHRLPAFNHLPSTWVSTPPPRNGMSRETSDGERDQTVRDHRGGAHLPHPKESASKDRHCCSPWSRAEVLRKASGPHGPAFHPRDRDTLTLPRERSQGKMNLRLIACSPGAGRLQRRLQNDRA